MQDRSSEIKKHKHAEKVSAKKAEAVCQLLEVAPDPLVIARRDGTIALVNEQIEKSFGYSRKELIGQTLRKLVPEYFRSNHVQNRIDNLTHLRKRPMETGPGLFGRRKDGSEFPVEIILCRVKTQDGLLFANSIRDISRRKQLENAHRTSEERLRLLLETTDAIPWEANARTWQFTFVGPQAVKLLGYPLEQWYEKDFWTSRIHPDDRGYVINFCQMRSSTCRDYELEYRMVSSDSSAVWLHNIVSCECVNGTPETLRGFMINITVRKRTEEALQKSYAELRELAGKLLSAQEDESRRIARELHDDLTQRLAVLAIEAGKLELQLESSPDLTRDGLRRMKEMIVTLSTDIHRISRRLHPSILDDLGLVKAIESECTQFSELERISVEFSHQNLPEVLPKAVSLCIYRITQESLRNIAKHAQAKEVRVILAGIGGSILLRIQDVGVGFDPDQVRGRPGLGLLSMKERVRLIQGKLSVHSKRGRGTTIEARVPMAERN
jgi:PAS domain S-box-containing protein